MAEMISKWAVVDMLTALENEFQHYKPFEGFEHAMYRKVCEVEMEIGKMDAVSVVHCRDCICWQPEFGVCGRYCTSKPGNGYCDMGKRRNNA